MATLISTIVTNARIHLTETSASYWTDAELNTHAFSGIRDLWRPTVDLKAEHYFKRDNTNVTLQANADQLSGVPTDVHKVYLIEARDMSETGSNNGLAFQPRDYNHKIFQGARTRSAIDPQNDIIYYAITGQGGPVNAPAIYIAPQVNSTVNLSFVYIPTLGPLTANDYVPIPGEADNALVAWVVAYARAKEREDRSPDPEWLAVYSTEKQNLLESLGLRQYQDPLTTDAMFEEYW